MVNLKDLKIVVAKPAAEMKPTPVPQFIPVTDITNVPAMVTKGTPLALSGTVVPSNATNKTITWSVVSGSATVSGNTLNVTAAAAAGTVTVRATVVNGKTATTNYTKNFAITIKVTSPLHDKLVPIMGRGCDITGRYAWSPEVKAPIMDLQKLRENGQVEQDPNLKYGEFETVTGSSVNEYSHDYACKVTTNASASVKLVGSFSAQVKKNFSSSRTERNDYSFATSRMNIAKDAYRVKIRNSPASLRSYLHPTFEADLRNNNMTPAALVTKYGTHVMLGGVLGARLDHSMSAQKKTMSSQDNIGFYTEARANANFLGIVKGSVSTTVQVDNTYKSYFETNSVEVKTFAYGGDEKWAASVHTKGDYDKWIASINNNTIVWCDYYPNSLVPIYELTTDSARRTAIKNYCDTYIKAKGANISTAMRNGSKVIVTNQIKKSIGDNSVDKLEGDWDISSQSGRSTLWWLEVKVEADPNSYNQSRRAYSHIKLTYSYKVKENYKDWSTLRLHGTKRIDLGAWFVSLEGVIIDDLEGKINGKNHDWNNVSISNAANRLVRALSIRIDGSGNDDNNIGFNASLNLKYVERTMQ